MQRCGPYTPRVHAQNELLEGQKTYNLVVDGVHLWRSQLVDAVVGRVLYPKGKRLLERPRRNFPRKHRVPRGLSIGQRLVGVLVAEQVDAPGEHDTRVFEGLEASDEAELAACPEALAGFLGRVEDGVCAGVVYGVGCEALCGCPEDGYEVGTVAEGVWDTGEPHWWDVGGGKG